MNSLIANWFIESLAHRAQKYKQNLFETQTNGVVVPPLRCSAARFDKLYFINAAELVVYLKENQSSDSSSAGSHKIDPQRVDCNTYTRQWIL